MKSRKTFIAVAFVLIGIIVAIVVFKQFRTPSSPLADGNKNQSLDESKEHSESDDKKVLHISEAEMKEFGIEVGTAGPGKIEIQLSLPGEVVANADRLVHVVPRVSGVVRDVRKNLGDFVSAGEVLSILESRELADAKASFLAAREREILARANFTREEDLWKKKISAEQDYLEAKRAIAEALIELRSSEQKLHAIGFSDAYLSRLPNQLEIEYTKYVLTAPASGTILQKHIAKGEVLKDDSEAFVIADLSSVWVNISIYQKDMPLVRKGQEVIISAGHEIPDARGVISYVGPLVGEQTRTGIARVVLPNKGGHWRPGLFITARLTVKATDVPIAVSKTALQTMEDKTYIFVKTEEGFESRPVTAGRTDEKQAEIISGLAPGQQYVTNGAFALKAQLSKSAFGDEHGH
ncbi:MAG: hypothetical protein A2Z47_02005 [Thermodesulfovibrio sp. RBG_19FT_COMBO_42_12]|nr:MAG: hypothetical protein A2Z47_02005 [Thermodesulfovibrio sp. RBG_19FT_COMBO_42_12]